MTLARKLALGVATSALLVTAGCATDPETGQQRITKAGSGAAIGAGAGALLGAILGGRNNRAETILGAGIGAIAGGAVGNYMDKQERELRQRTQGTGIEVQRQGDEIRLQMPSGITFDTNQAVLKPEFRPALDRVAETLANYPSTFIDVYGHTDSTGSDAINQPLSERRAQAVADYLSTRGVNRARVATRGFGSSQPVASNDTEAGRAENRRVEVRIAPVTQQDAQRAGS